MLSRTEDGPTTCEVPYELVMCLLDRQAPCTFVQVTSKWGRYVLSCVRDCLTSRSLIWASGGVGRAERLRAKKGAKAVSPADAGPAH